MLLLRSKENHSCKTKQLLFIPMIPPTDTWFLIILVLNLISLISINIGHTAFLQFQTKPVLGLGCRNVLMFKTQVMQLQLNVNICMQRKNAKFGSGNSEPHSKSRKCILVCMRHNFYIVVSYSCSLWQCMTNLFCKMAYSYIPCLYFGL